MKALWRCTGAMLAGSLAELFPRLCQVETAAARRGGWEVDLPADWCHRCGASAGPGAATPQGCAVCVGKPVPWSRIERLGVYGDPLDRWIIALKFARQWPWAPWFGGQLAQRLGPGDASAQQKVVVCPVPMHWLRGWRRGFNQAELMAAALGRVCGWPVAPLLHRTQYTPPQTAIPHSQRRANVRRSFVAGDVDLSGWEVWLVDDVKTTGSTLGVCAALLRRAGAARINVAVAAVADPRGTDFTRV